MVVAKTELNYYPEEVVERKVVEEHTIPKKATNAKKRQRSNARLKIFGFFVAIFVMSFSLFILLGYANISKVGLEISQLERERNQLLEEKSAIISKLETIKASRRIGDEAIYKLGMTYPKNDQIVYISVDEVQGINDVESGKERLKGLEKILGLFSSLF